MADATVANQRQILANQRTILANQRSILVNQKRLQGNQAKILSNQKRILAKLRWRLYRAGIVFRPACVQPVDSDVYRHRVTGARADA